MKTLFKYFQILLVLGFIIVEEITWKRIGEPIYKRFKALKVMELFTHWVRSVKHRYFVLIIFIIPFILMEVFSTAGLIAFGQGQMIAGVMLYAIKIGMTVPVVIIFNTAKEILVTFFLVKYIYGMVLNFKRSTVFRETKMKIKEIKDYLKVLKIRILGNKKSTFVEELEVIYTEVKKI